jgi:molybdenum cofactor cytidylyltransferase
MRREGAALHDGRPDGWCGGVAGVVLAAGSSSRMGENKLLLPLEGSTVLRRAVATAVAGGLDPVLVVIGHESERARAELAGLACEPVLNPDHSRGINSSLCAGISAVPGGCAAAVVMLADMPFVTAEMIGAVVERFRSGGAPLVLSVYGDVLAPPTLYARALFPELSALEGEGCGKRVMKRHRGEALEIAWPAAKLADLDVPADVDRIRGQLEGS